MSIRISVFLILMLCVAAIPTVHSSPPLQDDGRPPITTATAAEIVPIALFNAVNGEFRQLGFGDDSLVASTADGGARVWSADNFELTHSIENGTSAITGNAVVTLTENGQGVALTSLDSDEITFIGDHDDVIESVVSSPDGTLIATSSADNTVRVWDVENQVELIQLPAYIDASPTLVFDPTSSILASINEDTVRLWLTDSENNRQFLVPGTPPIAFSPDGLLIAFREQPNTVTIKSMLQIINEQPETTVSELIGHFQPITDIAFSPDGNLVATASDDSTISLWNPRSGEEIRILMGHTAPITQILFTADSSLIISASTDHTIRVWDTETGESLAVLEGHQSGVEAIALNTDETYLASTDGSTLIVWGFGEAISLPSQTVDATNEDTPQTTNGIIGTAQAPLTAGRDSCPIQLGESLLAVARSDSGQVMVYAGGMGCEGPVWLSNTAEIRWQEDELESLPLLQLSLADQSPLLRIVDYEAVCSTASGNGTLSTSNVPFTAYPPDNLPENLQSTMATGINAVICHEYSTVTIENCHNIGPGNYSYIYIRKRLDDTIRLVDYETGAIIAEERFIGGDPPACPTTAIRGEGIGDPPLPNIWVNWVSETLTGVAATPRTIISNGTVNVRLQPNTAADILTELPQNTPVNLIGQNAAGDWVLALLPDMSRGWLFVDLLTVASQTELSELPVVDGAADEIEIQVR